MKNNPISVVICGLVRDPGRLMQKVSNFIDWRHEGYVNEIVYATWIGEVDRYPSLRKQLRERGVLLVEIEEPRLVLKGGHQLHQMLAFYYALSSLQNRDQFVLKTRVDLADNHEAMLYDFEHGTDAVDDFAGFGLQNRILVENTQMFYPFLCGDAQFFGRLSDLRKLINMSAEMELTMNRLAVEQTFFFEPFKRSKLFRQHFYWNLPHISEIADRRELQLDEVWAAEPMKLVIKAWWVILDTYFKVGWGKYLNINVPISSYKDACRFDDAVKVIGGDRSDVIANQVFVRALLDLLQSSELDEIKRRVSDCTEDNPIAVDEVTFNAYESFRRKFSDLPSPKAVRRGDHRPQIRGAAQHFFVKGEQDDASVRYHEQVTALRRENDYLKAQLNITLTNTLLHRTLNRALPRSVIVFMKYRMRLLTDLYARYFMRKRG